MSLVQVICDIKVAFDRLKMDQYRKLDYVTNMWLDCEISNTQMKQLRGLIERGCL